MRERVAGRIVVAGFVLLAVVMVLVTSVTALRLQRFGADRPRDEQPPVRAAGLPPLPEVPLASMEPAVQRQFKDALARLEDPAAEATGPGRLGELLHAYGFLDGAGRCYTRAAALDGNGRWEYPRAVVLFELGRWSEARAALDRVVARQPRAAGPLLHRGEVNRRLNRLDEALDDYELVIDLDAAPERARAYCGAGQIALRRGELEIALEDLTAALQLEPEYGAARYALGQALRKLGRTDDARRELALADRHRDREPPLDAALAARLASLRTGAIDALHTGIDLAQAGDLVAAVERYHEALRLNPDLAETHAQLGAAQLARGRLDEAQHHLDRGLELDPGNADARYNLGVLAHERRQHETAVQHFRQAVALRPGHFDAQLGLGTDLRQLGHHEKSLAPLRAAMSCRPGDPRPYKRLAGALAALGRYGEAVAVLHLGTTRVPDDASIADRLAWILATCPAADIRDPARALDLAESACRRTRYRVARALDTKAAALAALQRYEEAIETAQSAADLARAGGDEELLTQIEQRLQRYRAGRPWESE